MRKLAKNLPFLLIAFLLGVFIASLVTGDVFVAATILIIACAIFVLAAVIPIRFGVLLGCLLIGMTLGILHYDVWQKRPLDPLLAGMIGGEAVYIGIVDDEPDIRENTTRLVVRIEEASVSGATTTISSRILVLVDRYPAYAYGDRLLLRGTLVAPRVFADEEGRVFDYPMYLRTKDIDAEMFHPVITVLAPIQKHTIRKTLLALKHQFLENIARVLPEPESALAGGILLGQRRTLGEDWNERFRVVGLTHILVLSGYNMTIIAEWLGRTALLVGFYAGTALSVIGIVLFTLMVGAGATVVRAAMMALLVLFARVTGRTTDTLRALLFACALMVAHNPGILAHDPSFQLSFLATFGLITLSPLIVRRTTFLARFPRLRDAFATTVATQIVVLPLLLYQTGLFSLIALPANLLVLPLVPFAMVAAFFAGVCGFFGDLFAITSALPATIILSYILLVGSVGAKLPFAAVVIPAVPAWVVVFCYAMIGVFLYVFTHRQAGK